MSLKVTEVTLVPVSIALVNYMTRFVVSTVRQNHLLVYLKLISFSTLAVYANICNLLIIITWVWFISV